MSAILCGKRSSYFEEIQGSSSSSSSSSSPSNPINKRIRCSNSPVRFSQPAFLLIDQLVSIFPFMDKKVIEQALENSGYDLDLAIESLKDLHLGHAETHLGAADTSSNTYPHTNNQVNGNGDEGGGLMEDQLPSGNSAVNGTEWVELLVQEMNTSSNMHDARARASRVLEAYEKSVYAHASKEAAQSFQQENIMLKQQVEGLIHENGILKRAVSIQHERQKEYDAKSQEVQQLKQLVAQCQGHIRTLEVNNYALAMHLKQAQQNNTMPGRSNPDVF